MLSMNKNFLFLLFSIPFAMCLVILLASCTADKKKQSHVDIPPFEALNDSLSLESACKAISLNILSRLGDRDTVRPALFFRTLDKAVDSLANALGSAAQGPAGCRAIIDVVYNEWGLAFDPRDDAIETIVPHLAFHNKKGNCIGVSLIILMMAERLQCPVFGVVLPSHFFCRFEDHTARFNIEPNRKGFQHLDDYYRTKYLADQSWYDLANLTKKEVIGVLYYTLGTQRLKRNDFGLAIVFLQESVRRFPKFVEAEGNYALALALCGNFQGALSVFEGLFQSHPSFPQLAVNYGAVAMAAGQYHKAMLIYKKGLVFSPSDPKLLVGLAQAYAKGGMKDSIRDVQK